MPNGFSLAMSGSFAQVLSAPITLFAILLNFHFYFLHFQFKNGLD